MIFFTGEHLAFFIKIGIRQRNIPESIFQFHKSIDNIGVKMASPAFLDDFDGFFTKSNVTELTRGTEKQ